MSDVPLLGVEEEFHVVDLESRRSASEVDSLLAQLDGAEFAPELQRSLVETNTPVCGTLDELRGHLRRLRATLEGVAEPLGLGVVAAAPRARGAPGGGAAKVGGGPRSRSDSAWSRPAPCRSPSSTATPSR